MSDDLHISGSIVIPAADLSYAFSRSGGPGGQHVNTTETRVQLRFNLDHSALHPDVKARIRAAHPGLITSDGDILLASDASRSRKMNVDAARERLAELIRRQLVPPKPRRATKPSKGAKQRRTDDKTRRGAVKKSRGKVDSE